MKSTSITRLTSRPYSPEQRGVPMAEAELHEAALAAAETLAPPDCPHLIVIPELEIGSMRPDLWIGYFNDEQFQTRVEAGIEPCTAPYPLKVAYELRRLGGLCSLERLCSPARGLGERRRILRGLAELIERGLAERNEGAVRLNAAWTPAEAHGVGVEAKVGRWRKAVRQVQMSGAFLNGAWLVFPSSYLPNFPRGQKALRNLGVAVVESDALRVIRKPRLRSGRNDDRVLLEEHLYARWCEEL